MVLATERSFNAFILKHVWLQAVSFLFEPIWETGPRHAQPCNYPESLSGKHTTIWDRTIYFVNIGPTNIAKVQKTLFPPKFLRKRLKQSQAAWHLLIYCDGRGEFKGVLYPRPVLHHKLYLPHSHFIILVSPWNRLAVGYKPHIGSLEPTNHHTRLIKTQWTKTFH